MATIQKRGEVWRVQVRLRGVARSSTFDSHEEARAWAAEQEAVILKRAKAAGRSNTFMSIPDLFDRYALEVTPTKRGGKWDRIRLKLLAADPRLKMDIRDLTPMALAQWRDGRMQEVSAASVNREMNLISSVFGHAIREWHIGGLTENPVRAIKRPKQPKARTRRVTDLELEQISGVLGWDRKKPPTRASHWVAWVAYFAVETAMRKGEILGMKWGQVHLDKKYVQLLDGETKNGFGRQVPLSKRASGLLEMLWPGRPVDAVATIASGTLDTLFRRACKAARIEGLHFHDTRREATTRIAAKVGNPLILGKITGHRDLKSLWVYFEPTGTDLADLIRK